MSVVFQEGFRDGKAHRPIEDRDIRRGRRSTIATKMTFETFHGSFCFCFSVQAGACILASMGIVLMVTTSLVNVTGETHPSDEQYHIVHYPVLYSYTFAMIVGFFFQLYGAVKPSAVYLTISCVILSAFFLFWLVISIMSFIESPAYLMYSVCIFKRCPETHWIYCTLWRRYKPDCFDKLDNLFDDSDHQYNDKTGNHGKGHQGRKGKTSYDESLEDDYYELTEEGQFTEFENKRGELRLAHFVSKDSGCPVNRGLMMTISIIICLCWSAIMVYDIVTIVALITHIDQMRETGEIDFALKRPLGL